MALITFIERDGTRRTSTSTDGSLMQAALAAGVRGIEGQCGGFAACGTCHVHLPDDWLDLLGTAPDAELAMLEFEAETTRSSRLCCQIAVTPQLDGLIVHVARE
jgi:ferredoxin, 2Fe-2S